MGTKREATLARKLSISLRVAPILLAKVFGAAGFMR